MRSQKSEDKGTMLHYSITPVFLLLLTAYCLLPTAIFATEKWSGVDETVIGKYAKEHGREAREPFINTDQGNMLLFLFLLAGAIGGFAAGYYWRMLSEERTRDLDVKNQLMGNGRPTCL
jgi:ABC-type cobalt transport system substrate-binding protein